MERLFSEQLEKQRQDYLKKYGWSLLRDTRLTELMNNAYSEGKGF